METLYIQILALLAQKKTLFSEFENVTETMYCMQAEDLAAAMDQRGLLLEQVAELDRQLAACAAGREDIRAALAHSCGREGLAPQLAEIYDAALAVKAVVNRLIKNKDSVYLHPRENGGAELRRSLCRGALSSVCFDERIPTAQKNRQNNLIFSYFPLRIFKSMG